MKAQLTEEKALAQSTGWASIPYVGYLPFSSANYLVSTGKYEVCCWGYILKQKQER